MGRKSAVSVGSVPSADFVAPQLALEGPPAEAEPSSCTGNFHVHRWLRFGKDGQRDVAEIRVFSDGLVHISEQAINQLLEEAGYSQHDPDPVEVSAAKRLSWARSRLQDALNRRVD